MKTKENESALIFDRKSLTCPFWRAYLYLRKSYIQEHDARVALRIASRARIASQVENKFRRFIVMAAFLQGKKNKDLPEQQQTWMIPPDDPIVKQSGEFQESELFEVIGNVYGRADAPWIWGFHPKAYSLFHGWYGNAKPNLMARNTLKYKSIDVNARNRLRAKWNEPIVWPIFAVLVLLIISGIPAYLAYRRQRESTAQ